MKASLNQVDTGGCCMCKYPQEESMNPCYIRNQQGRILGPTLATEFLKLGFHLT